MSCPYSIGRRNLPLSPLARKTVCHKTGYDVIINNSHAFTSTYSLQTICVRTVTKYFRLLEVEEADHGARSFSALTHTYFLIERYQLLSCGNENTSPDLLLPLKPLDLSAREGPPVRRGHQSENGKSKSQSEHHPDTDRIVRPIVLFRLQCPETRAFKRSTW